MKQAIEEKERKEQEEGKMKMDIDKTPPASELEDAAKELAAAKVLAMATAKESAGTKRKRRWDVPDSSDENVDPNKPDMGEWSKEALEASAPKKRRSRWDATLAEAAIGKTPERSRWDQTPAASNVDVSMTRSQFHAGGQT